MQVAWDTRIQRKVAIKCIPLSEAELERAALPGADAIVLPDEEDEARSYGSAMHGMSSGAEPGSAGCAGVSGAGAYLRFLIGFGLRDCLLCHIVGNTLFI